MFPLRAQEGGVLVRAGQTEASVDLARMAGLLPAAVVCEIMNEDGTMARMPQLEIVSEELGVNIVAVADLIAYRLERDALVERVADARLPTRYGLARAIAYRSAVDAAEHVALVFGAVSPDEPTLVRVHSECLTGDVFGSLRCDCGTQREMAIQAIAEEGRGGVPLYAPGGARHRPPQQDQSLRPAGQRRRQPSRRTGNSASPPTSGTTASAPRSSSTSASAKCGL